MALEVPIKERSAEVTQSQEKEAGKPAWITASQAGKAKP